MNSDQDSTHPALVDLQAIEFRYPRFLLGPLTLRIDPGSAVALVGPNGRRLWFALRTIVEYASVYDRENLELTNGVAE